MCQRYVRFKRLHQPTHSPSPATHTREIPATYERPSKMPTAADSLYGVILTLFTLCHGNIIGVFLASTELQDARCDTTNSLSMMFGRFPYLGDALAVVVVWYKGVCLLLAVAEHLTKEHTSYQWGFCQHYSAPGKNKHLKKKICDRFL